MGKTVPEFIDKPPGECLLVSRLCEVLSDERKLTALFPADASAGDAPTSRRIFPADDGRVAPAPSLIVAGEYEPCEFGFTGDLQFELRALPHDGARHAARMGALMDLLFGPGVPAGACQWNGGPAPAKDALRAALAAKGVRLGRYGLGKDAVLADFDGGDLRILLRVKVEWSALA